MDKVAKLVTVQLTTRVIVDENANDVDLMAFAIPKLQKKLDEDGILDHVFDIVQDTECPFGTFQEDLVD